MIYPRLKLLHKLLADDGIVIISIDKNEYSSLHLVLDEIFGKTNSIGTVIWKNANDNNPTHIAVEHEYIMFYAKNKSSITPVWKSAEIDIKRKLIDLGKQLIDKYSEQDDLQRAYSNWLKVNKNWIWPFEDYKFIDTKVYTLAVEVFTTLGKRDIVTTCITQRQKSLVQNL